MIDRSMLSLNEQKYIISQFPQNMKLCYENFNHNKVKMITGDVYLAIPYGKKCFAWFTIHNGLEVCFVLELNESRQISRVKIYNCVFQSDLVFGTIVFGSIFNTGSFITCFTVEDIFWYKGVDVGGFDWFTKWRYMEVFFKDIKQIAYNKHFIVFGLPHMSSNGIEDFLKTVLGVPYNIYRIQARNYSSVGYAESMTYQKMQEYFKDNELTISNNCLKEPLKEPIHSNNYLKESFKELKEPIIQLNNSNNCLSLKESFKEPKELQKELKESFKEPKEFKESFKESTKPQFNKNQNHNQNHNQNSSMIVFEVRPDIQNDIYHLYCCESSSSTKLIYYDIALIPDMHTSVKLNKLFRNIKENENMDYMEESDSEEEFEDNREDKYVYLERKIKMYCKFNSKFKKWVPIEEMMNITVTALNDVKKYR